LKTRPVEGSGGVARLILNLPARHIKWSTWCCHQSHHSCPAMG